MDVVLCVVVVALVAVVAVVVVVVVVAEVDEGGAVGVVTVILVVVVLGSIVAADPVVLLLFPVEFVPCKREQQFVLLKRRDKSKATYFLTFFSC